jgi:hypothetical protein
VPKETRYTLCPSGHWIKGGAYFVYRQRYGHGELLITIDFISATGEYENIAKAWGTRNGVKERLEKDIGHLPYSSEIIENAIHGASLTDADWFAKCRMCQHLVDSPQEGDSTIKIGYTKRLVSCAKRHLWLSFLCHDYKRKE